MQSIRATGILKLLIGVGTLWVFSAMGQITTHVPLHQTWKYLYDGTDQGTAWRGTAFEDSSWAEGQTLMGFESASVYFEPFQTLLPDPATIGYPRTAYFRTTFSVNPALPAHAIFYLTNWIDDGAVFYINGAEVGRLRMTNNAAAPVTFNDFAVSGIEGQANVIVFGYTNFTLQPSGNLLAVEVHQATATSGDIVFGSILTSEIPQPVVITNQPADLTVSSNQPAAFAVGVTGTRPAFQWYRDGFKLSNATNATFAINNARPIDSGNYFVVVTNGYGYGPIVTSRLAQLTVIRDMVGPELVSAIVRTEPTYSNKVDVTFADPSGLRAPTINTISNYSIHIFGTTNVLKITSAASSSGITRLVVDQLWDHTKTYILTVNNIQDSVGNISQPNSQIGVRFTVRTNIFDMTATPEGRIQEWRWHEDFTEPADWKSPNWVDDGTWGGPTPGIFYFDQDNWLPCSGMRTREVSIGFVTYYFRTTFTLSNLPSTAILRINSIFDDGGIIWLNERETYRYQMPPGPVTPNTYATVETGANPPPCILASPAVTNLLNGTNVLGVEIHQSSSTTALDIAMGLDLDIEYLTPPFEFPKLFVMRSGNEISVIWPGAPWKLETKMDLTSPVWTPLDVATNVFQTNIVHGGQQYFRATHP